MFHLWRTTLLRPSATTPWEPRAWRRIAQAEGVANFVMVSTDKAVNPISIMGASKRIAELALFSLNNPKNRMSALRLANVLGSGGSVVPTFLKQISRGGPVTVTHQDVSRYFLTMSEAVELILLASGLEESGGIFVPQVDGRVKIRDVAIELIRDNPIESRIDIPVTFTGLRPGDKMSEELFFQDESQKPATDSSSCESTPLRFPQAYSIIRSRIF